MIFEIGGKKLAFGMDWHMLVEPGAYSAVAARRAFALKSPLLWHQGSADYAGFIRAKETALSSGAGDVYAAAQALMSVPNIPQNVLLIARTPDRNFAVIGLYRGRPASRFDQTGLAAERVQQIFSEFGQKCGEEGFALLGDSDAPLPEKPEPITLEEIASYASDACLLKPPSRAGLYKRVALVCATVGMFSTVGWYAKQTLYPKDPQQEKTPTERYQENLQARASDPIVTARDYKEWNEWWRSSLRKKYGGWTIKSVKCDFRSPGSRADSYAQWSGTPQCSLTFTRTDKHFATNETFFRAAPKEWASQAIYLPQQDEMIVTAPNPPVMRSTQLGKVLQVAGKTKDRDVHFISKMQAASRMVQAPALPDAVPFLLPPGVPIAEVQGTVYWATHWSFKGQAQFASLLDDFPPYATISAAEMTLEDESNPEVSPYKVDLQGELFTRK